MTPFYLLPVSFIFLSVAAIAQTEIHVVKATIESAPYADSVYPEEKTHTTLRVGYELANGDLGSRKNNKRAKESITGFCKSLGYQGMGPSLPSESISSITGSSYSPNIVYFNADGSIKKIILAGIPMAYEYFEEVECI